MREETRPDGSSAVDRVHASGCGMDEACACENQLLNWGVGVVGCRSLLESVDLVNCSAWPWGEEPAGATGSEGALVFYFILILFLLLPSSRANPRRRASAGVTSFFFPSFSWFQGEAGLQMSLAWDGRRYSAMVVRANSALGRVQRINE